jgi:hypothetical protein
MRYLMLFIITFVFFDAGAQPAWQCLYSDSTMVVLQGETLSRMKERMATEMQEKGFPVEAIDTLLKEFKVAPAYFTAGERYVVANVDSTLITTESSDNRVEKLLLKGDDIYIRTGSGNYDSLLKTARKNFKLSGRQHRLLDHDCKEYVSSDSTVVIWVAEDLPSWINPGVRTGGIKGAVLYYELKKSGFVLMCRITKLRKVNKEI